MNPAKYRWRVFFGCENSKTVANGIAYTRGGLLSRSVCRSSFQDLQALNTGSDMCFKTMGSYSLLLSGLLVVCACDVVAKSGRFPMSGIDIAME